MRIRAGSRRVTGHIESPATRVLAALSDLDTGSVPQKESWIALRSNVLIAERSATIRLLLMHRSSIKRFAVSSDAEIGVRSDVLRVAPTCQILPSRPDLTLADPVALWQHVSRSPQSPLETPSRGVRKTCRR